MGQPGTPAVAQGGAAKMKSPQTPQQRVGSVPATQNPAMGMSGGGVNANAQVTPQTNTQAAQPGQGMQRPLA